MRRTLITSGALVAAIAGSLVLAPVASATGGPKGDNGTVKIHDSKTGEEIKANQPKVCEFYLDAFNQDAQQKVTWHIEAWAVNERPKGETVKDGKITLNDEGHGRTEDMTLDNGQYKLFWKFEGQKGTAKHKVFKVRCEDEEQPGSPSPSESTPGSPSPSESTPGTPGSPSPSESAPGNPSPSETPTPGSTESPAAPSPGSTNGPDDKGNLAETGSSTPVGTIAAVAVALAAAGAGAVVVTRRRRTQQH